MKKLLLLGLLAFAGCDDGFLESPKTDEALAVSIDKPIVATVYFGYGSMEKQVQATSVEWPSSSYGARIVVIDKDGRKHVGNQYYIEWK